MCIRDRSNGTSVVGTYGTLIIGADGSYTYTANQDAADALDDSESATDVFTYTVSDGTSTDTATITITVNGSNDAPVAQNDTGTVNEDATLTVSDGDGSSTVAGASYVDSISTYSLGSASATQPQDIKFNNDGTKMFVVDGGSDAIREYTLSTGYDISTASYDSVFSVSSQDTSPTGLAFNNDGTKMFVVGSTGQDINEYHLTTGFDVSTASYDSNFSVANKENGPNGMAFNSDGTKIFMADRADETIEQFKLTTAYDISTCVHEDEITLGITTLADIAFSRDGMKLFIYDQHSGAGAQYTVEQYALTSPYNLTNATLVATYTGPNGSIRTNIQQFAQAMVFNIDGTKMYITGGKATSTATHGGVYEFTLSSPFDVNGAITYEGEFDPSAQVGQIAGLTFSANGSKMYITDFTNGSIGNRGVYAVSYTHLRAHET